MVDCATAPMSEVAASFSRDESMNEWSATGAIVSPAGDLLRAEASWYRSIDSVEHAQRSFRSRQKKQNKKTMAALNDRQTGRVSHRCADSIWVVFRSAIRIPINCTSRRSTSSCLDFRFMVLAMGAATAERRSIKIGFRQKRNFDWSGSDTGG